MSTQAPASIHRRVLAVAGNPNSGKTTLFNRLTGLRQKVANYAGVTVEKKSGTYLHGAAEVELIDLPGTYSLSPRSEEERVAAEVILGIHEGVSPVDGVLCIIDSTSLEKSLYLLLQIIETGMPAVVLLNMADELVLRGARIDTVQLSRLLDVPVLSISATQGQGIDEVKTLIEEWNWTPRSPRPAQQLPVVPTEAQIVTRRMQVKQIIKAALLKEPRPHPWTDRIDGLVMHKIWGPLIFGAVVLIVFQSIFSWAQPGMDAIDGIITSLGRFVQARLPESIFRSFLTDGVIAGVGSILVFLPQILIVFFFIGILEHSGYLARAALVMDRFMNRMGLQGKSFLPLVSSYACAVPGIMATRTIENKRDRLATILVAPFMTCSARLPVYTFLIAAFVPDRSVFGPLGLRALTLLGLYAAGFAAAMVTAWILKSSILKSDRTPFFLEIPPYRLPWAKTIFLFMWDRAKIFLRRAGTIILLTTIILWALASFPRVDGKADLENSFAGRIGKVMEPVIQPLGFNWKIGVGLLSAQAAREVMVSSLATIYHVESEGDDTTDLQQAIKADLTPLAAVSLMVFFAFAMQCMSTLAVARRETGGWKIPLAMFGYMNLVAYLASFIVFQGGRMFGFY
jgi:ferrous iron transport protein B